jgi:hypothetical protein
LWFADDYPPGKTDFKDKLSVTVERPTRYFADDEF